VPVVEPEEIDLSTLELPTMEELDLPDICGCDADVELKGGSANVTLSELDDSVGLVPHLGSLEILDHSDPTPLK
jgi:hypothetical protein